MSNESKPQPDVATQPAATPATDPGSLDGITLFIVTESANQGRQLLQMLDHLGARADLAERDGGGFNLAAGALHDIAVIDTTGQAGRDALDRMAAESPRPRLIALICGDAPPGRDLPAGADAHLDLPLMEIERLERTVLALTGAHAPLTGPPVAHASARDVPPASALPRLDAVLRIAGPDTAADILAQLQTDLEATLAALVEAAAAGDMAQARGASHVLISLAGSVGDDALLALAEQANGAAQRGDAQQIATLAAQIRSAVARLLGVITARAARLTRSGAPGPAIS